MVSDRPLNRKRSKLAIPAVCDKVGRAARLRTARLSPRLLSRFRFRRSLSPAQGVCTAWTWMTSCSTPGTCGATFSSKKRSCCSWLSQISETVNLPSLSMNATWYLNPGALFTFSTSGGETSSYCAGGHPLSAESDQHSHDCSLQFGGYRHHPCRNARPVGNLQREQPLSHFHENPTPVARFPRAATAAR